MAPDPGAAGFLAVLAACGVIAWAWMRLDDRRQARERDRLAAKVTPIDRYRGQGSNVTVTRHGRGGAA